MTPVVRASAPLLCALLLFAAGCDDGRPDPDAGRPDGATGADAGALDGGALDGGGDEDAGSGGDAGASDAGGSSDAGRADGGPPDAGTDAGVDAGTDAGVDAGTDAGTPPRSDHHIHIDVDNFCNMTVTPMDVTIPADQTAFFDWHDHSDDYAVDVWMSYGGGYTDLPTHATWDEPVGHCIGPSPHTEYADISTACSSFRFLIHCL